MTNVNGQLAEVEFRRPGAAIESMPGGQDLLVVPMVPLPPGWNRPAATVSILVPTGYPHARLDCFYTEPDLRLANGADPANSSVQAVFGGQYRWFSWHVTSWDPVTGTLDRYVRFCESRLKEAR
jgi:hypothetical protein